LETVSDRSLSVLYLLLARRSVPPLLKPRYWKSQNDLFLFPLAPFSELIARHVLLLLPRADSYIRSFASRLAERFRLDQLASLALDDLKEKLIHENAGQFFSRFTLQNMTILT